MYSIKKKYKLLIDSAFDQLDFSKGAYIVVLHATRIPPHIGMIIGGNYHSLTIKGQDINVPVASLIKTIQHRNISSLFIKIKIPELYNEIYLMNRFIDKIKQFTRVDVNVATCLSPLKLLFEEEYALSMEGINYVFELLPQLETFNLIKSCGSLFIDSTTFTFSSYSMEQINAEIGLIRADYK